MDNEKDNNAIKIEEWIKEGELESAEAHTIGDVKDQYVDEDIIGDPLFLGSDGIWYTVAAVITKEVRPANPNWVHWMLSDELDKAEEKTPPETSRINNLKKWLEELPEKGKGW